MIRNVELLDGKFICKNLEKFFNWFMKVRDILNRYNYEKKYAFSTSIQG